MVSINRNVVTTMEDRIWKSFPSSSAATKMWCAICVLVLISFMQLNQVTFEEHLIVRTEPSTRLSVPMRSSNSTPPQTVSPTSLPTDTSEIELVAAKRSSVKLEVKPDIPMMRTSLLTSPKTLSLTIIPTNTTRTDYLQGVEYCHRESFPTTKWWKHFQEVAETNKAQAAKAMKHSPKSPPPGAHPRIPHRLIFTHQYNLFDCESKELTPVLNMLASNARETIALYRQFWDEPSAVVTLLTDEDCIAVLNATEPRLLEYFAREKGMFKADMCRIAELYLHGGYYFDVDLLAVHPVSPPDSVGFSSVRSSIWPKKGFFQAFTASAPGHPILKKSLDLLLEVYTGKRKRKGHLKKLIGPATMLIAYESYLKETVPEEVSKDLFLMDEIRIDKVRGNDFLRRHKPSFVAKLPRQERGGKGVVGFWHGQCNNVVHDLTTQYFYSRVNGTGGCHEPK